MSTSRLLRSAPSSSRRPGSFPLCLLSKRMSRYGSEFRCAALPGGDVVGRSVCTVTSFDKLLHASCQLRHEHLAGVGHGHAVPRRPPPGNLASATPSRFRSVPPVQMCCPSVMNRAETPPILGHSVKNSPSGAKNLHPLVVTIGHIDTTLPVNHQIVWKAELARPGCRGCPTRACTVRRPCISPRGRCRSRRLRTRRRSGRRRRRSAG